MKRLPSVTDDREALGETAILQTEAGRPAICEVSKGCPHEPRDEGCGKKYTTSSTPNAWEKCIPMPAIILSHFPSSMGRCKGSRPMTARRSCSKATEAGHSRRRSNFQAPNVEYRNQETRLAVDNKSTLDWTLSDFFYFGQACFKNNLMYFAFNPTEGALFPLF